VFDATTAGGVVFHAAAGLDAQAVAAVQACVRRRLLRVFVRRGLLPGDAAQAMGQWKHGGGFSVDGSVRIEAADRAGRERLLRYCARPPSSREACSDTTIAGPTGAQPNSSSRVHCVLIAGPGTACARSAASSVTSSAPLCP